MMMRRVLVFSLLSFVFCLPFCFAGGGAFSEHLPKEIKQLNAEILKLETEDDVEQFLANLEGLPEDNSGVKFYKAMFLPIRDFRYIIWRARNLVSHSLSLHMRSLGQITRLKNIIRENYGDSARAFFNYLTEIPKTGEIDAKVQKFTSAASLQDWLVGLAEGDGSLLKALSRLQEIEKDTDFKITIDRSIFLGMDYYLNNTYSMKNAMRFVDRDDVQGLIGRLQRRIANNYLVSMYNLEDLPKYTNKLVELTTMTNVFTNKFLPNDIHRVVVNSPKLRTDSLKGLTNFLTLRPKGKEFGQKALGYFAQAIENGRAWYLASLERPRENSNYLYQAEFLYIREDDKKLALDTIYNMYNSEKQPTSILNVNTGKSVAVNIKTFFLNPPSDLKSYFPNNFDTTIHRTIPGVKGSLHNYDYGSAKSFPKPAFDGILPGATNENIREKLNILKSNRTSQPLAWLLFITG